MIISGLEKRSLANNTTIVKSISQISKELEPVDYLRLLMIFLCTFDLQTKDRETLLMSIGKESYRDCVNNLSHLDFSTPEVVKKFSRKEKAPVMTKEELN